ASPIAFSLGGRRLDLVGRLAWRRRCIRRCLASTTNAVRPGARRNSSVNHPGLSASLREERYTARKGEEGVWPRTTRAGSPPSYWTSCWLVVIPRRYWTPAA